VDELNCVLERQVRELASGVLSGPDFMNTDARAELEAAGWKRHTLTYWTHKRWSGVRFGELQQVGGKDGLFKSERIARK
jgi:hypothetical protein